MTKPSVVIVGGGYAGFTAARALDPVADVTLVERREQFLHNVASLRAVVDPEWADRIFLPYDRLLEHGRVVQDEVVSATGQEVRLASGPVLRPDYLVLASGSTYAFPAKNDEPVVEVARAQYRDLQKEVEGSDRVLIVGAGPVGLELAGEIVSAWPDKQVTVVDLADHVLTGEYAEELRTELRSQLEARGVRFVLGSPLVALPQVPAGTRGTFAVTTEAGERIDGDLWLVAHGARPATDYLRGELAGLRDEDGRVPVTSTLQVPGLERVFAAGDITDVPEPKGAGRASRHAEVVAENIARLARGEQELDEYQPSPPVIIVPLGPDGGASQLPGVDGVEGPEATARIKGQDLFIGRYREVFGLPDA